MTAFFQKIFRQTNQNNTEDKMDTINGNEENVELNGIKCESAEEERSRAFVPVEESVEVSDESVVEETNSENSVAEETLEEAPVIIDVDILSSELVVEEVASPDLSLPNAIESLGNELRQLMEKLAGDFNVKIKYDVKKQEQIDQLYKENLSFRDGLVEQYKKKLVSAVIEQIDDAEKQIAHFRGAEFSEVNYKKLFASFEDIALSLRDMLLERFDVGNWQSEADTPFDPRRQRTLRTTPTGDTTKVKTICRSIRFGYEAADGTPLRPEMVDVYVYDASCANEDDNAVDG